MRSLLVRKIVAKFIYDYGNILTPGGTVLTSGWTELIASMSQPASAIEIFDSSGRVMKLAIGASGSEVELPYYITPGGSSILLPVEFSHGKRLAVRAVDGSATAGLLVINFFG